MKLSLKKCQSIIWEVVWSDNNIFGKVFFIPFWPFFFWFGFMIWIFELMRKDDE